MKMTARLLTLVLALLSLPFSPMAYAALDRDTVRGIYEALLAEDSAYSEFKASYLAFEPDTLFEEKLSDEGFTISVTDHEHYTDSWRFSRDGDYLVSSFAANDISGIVLSIYVLNAVGRYYDMDCEILSRYANILSAMKLENDYYYIAHDKENNMTTVRIYIAGPFDMKEIDDMLSDMSVLNSEKLNEQYFRLLADLETATAGSSLKTAKAACLVCSFVSTYDLYDQDAEQLRNQMDTAYTMLDEDEQSTFWQGFEAVSTLLDACLEDYEANRAVFEDAGVVDEMDKFMYDEMVLAGWEKLRDLSESLGKT